MGVRFKKKVKLSRGKTAENRNLQKLRIGR